mmetsp:Transcript_27736/g.36090  ORF Transcript_27736/g.36090 Transcript_27736/m.36090 type:complete len:637 (+) Transcript_27736:185-2095(+)
MRVLYSVEMVKNKSKSFQVYLHRAKERQTTNCREIKKIKITPNSNHANDDLLSNAEEESPTLAAVRSLNQLKNIPASQWEKESPTEEPGNPSSNSNNLNEDDDLPPSNPVLGGTPPSFLGCSDGGIVFSHSFINAMNDLEAADGTSKLRVVKGKGKARNSGTSSPEEDLPPPPAENPKLGEVPSFFKDTGGSFHTSSMFLSTLTDKASFDGGQASSESNPNNNLSPIPAENPKLGNYPSFSESGGTSSMLTPTLKDKASFDNGDLDKSIDEEGLPLLPAENPNLGKFPSFTGLLGSPDVSAIFSSFNLKTSNANDAENKSETKHFSSKKQNLDDDGLPPLPPNNPRLGEVPSFMNASSAEFRFSGIFTESFERKIKEGKSVSFDEKLNVTYDYDEKSPPRRTGSPFKKQPISKRGNGVGIVPTTTAIQDLIECPEASKALRLLRAEITPTNLNDHIPNTKKMMPQKILKQTNEEQSYSKHSGSVALVSTEKSSLVNPSASNLTGTISGNLVKAAGNGKSKFPFVIPKIAASSLASISTAMEPSLPLEHWAALHEQQTEDCAAVEAGMNPKTVYRRKKIKIWLEKRKRRKWTKDKPSKYANFKRQEAAKRKRDNGRFLKQEDIFVPMTNFTNNNTYF